MKKVKRIAAIIGIVIIASLYLVTFITSFFSSEYTHGLFLASVYSTFVIPVLIYAFMMIYRLFHKGDNLETMDNTPHKGTGSNLK
jgi:uncharacterized BrkB/YihY/UPF0761 family membrane protein